MAANLPLERRLAGYALAAGAAVAASQVADAAIVYTNLEPGLAKVFKTFNPFGVTALNIDGRYEINYRSDRSRVDVPFAIGLFNEIYRPGEINIAFFGKLDLGKQHAGPADADIDFNTGLFLEGFGQFFDNRCSCRSGHEEKTLFGVRPGCCRTKNNRYYQCKKSDFHSTAPEIEYGKVVSSRI